MPEKPDTLDPAGAFACDVLRCLAEESLSDVKARWRAKGQKWAERFEVLLPIALQGGAYRTAAVVLDTTEGNVGLMVSNLRAEIRLATRARVKDELRLEPGLSQASVEARIDEAIQELFDAAFPAKEDAWWELFRPEPDPGEQVQPEQPGAEAPKSDGPPESKR